LLPQYTQTVLFAEVCVAAWRLQHLDITIPDYLTACSKELSHVHLVLGASGWRHDQG
jgi:hypothetical protein